MLERFVHALHTDDAGPEDPAATRDRLRDAFPRGATRRMTQLGLLVGSLLQRLDPNENDTVVYASRYAETRALEGYLDSFPLPSPTLFQTSIHPSAVQQALIGRQQPLRRFFPLTGDAHLAAQSLLAAALPANGRTILCGGEERGTWLLEAGSASDRTIAFAVALSPDPAGAVARLRIDPSDTLPAPPALSFPGLFDHLHARRAFACALPGGGRILLDWL